VKIDEKCSENCRTVRCVRWMWPTHGSRSETTRIFHPTHPSVYVDQRCSPSHNTAHYLHCQRWRQGLYRPGGLWDEVWLLCHFAHFWWSCADQWVRLLARGFILVFWGSHRCKMLHVELTYQKWKAWFLISLVFISCKQHKYVRKWLT